VEAIAIGTAEGIDAIQQRLTYEFRYLQQEGVHVRIGQSNRGSLSFLDCSVEEETTPPEMDLLIRHTVAHALSDHIVDQCEDYLLRKIIRTSYSYFTPDEQDQILSYSDRTLNGPPGNSLRQKISRKCQILHRLRDYLDDGADELVLEGFLTFRLRDYMEELEDAVDKAVDDFLMEREYNEFVRLLQYFVEVQEPRLERVQVVMRPGGLFKLLDEEGRPVRSEYLEEFVVEMVESEVNWEDLLVSALITLAPRQILIHGADASNWDESLETIRRVFADRVAFCSACPICPGGATGEAETGPVWPLRGRGS
jgi:putative sporulation protein YtxC